MRGNRTAVTSVAGRTLEKTVVYGAIKDPSELCPALLEYVLQVSRLPVDEMMFSVAPKPVL